VVSTRLRPNIERPETAPFQPQLELRSRIGVVRALSPRLSVSPGKYENVVVR
jgi:hypothetical protein